MSLDEKPPAKRRGKVKTRVQQGIVPGTDNVVGLFGPDATVRDDPDSVVPKRDKTSTRQASKKIRVRGRWAEVYRDIDEGKITMKEFVKCLDKEELARGQMRSEDGTFRGAPPKFVPAELHQECVRELLRRGDEIWREAYIDSIKVFQDIATNPGLEPKDRLKAAQYVIERLAGKTPERVELAVVDPWEQIVTGIVAEAEDQQISRAARILAGETGVQMMAEDGD